MFVPGRKAGKNDGENDKTDQPPDPPGGNFASDQADQMKAEQTSRRHYEPLLTKVNLCYVNRPVFFGSGSEITIANSRNRASLPYRGLPRSKVYLANPFFFIDYREVCTSLVSIDKHEGD